MNKKMILSFVLGGLIFSCITVYAAYKYQAGEVGYTPSNENFDVDNVESAINELYKSVPGPTKTVVPGSTHKGIVYLDPTNIKKFCYEGNSVSTTETKQGCMKWYIYDDSGDEYTMILDHNTTARVKWNDDNINYAVTDDRANVKAVLANLVTTSKWKVTPRLITAEEVNTITGKTGFNSASTNSGYYLDTLTQNKGTFTNKFRSRYDWLYNNLNKCKSDSTDYGCSIEDGETYEGYGTGGSGQTFAYWTSTTFGTAGSGSNMWYVHHHGYLGFYGNVNYDDKGIRPVITISKSIIK